MSSLQVDFSTKYLLACLRLGVHIEGLVDAYYGPRELADSIKKERPKPLGELLIDLDELKKQVVLEPFEEMRRIFILKQITALESAARERMGVRTPYREFVGRTLDIEPKEIKEQGISELRRELETLLRRKGQQGNLTQMLQEFRKKRLISGERLADIFYNLVGEARHETQKVFKLPPGEHVDFTIVKDEPWTSDNKYRGNYGSLIMLNTGAPLTSTSLPISVTHQTYPGHHTEHVLKELELYSARKQLESSILLMNTPESTISEGLAETSRKFILGEPAMLEDKIQQIEIRLRRAVRVNAALMIYDRRLAADDAKEYFVEEGAYEKNESDKGMRLVLDPLYRTYLFTFYEGDKMVSEAWKRAKSLGKEERFLQILYREENCPTTFKEKTKKLFS
jgi:hypothetical protein